MKNHTFEPRPALWLAILYSASIAPVFLHAQDDADESEEIYELSPFTVEADKIEGYRATSTLAGTRIKTNLRDVASTISVYTKEFLEDTGATSVEELLVYTTGTEVAGMGGTLSNTSGSGTFELNLSAERFTDNSTTRVRGLAAADNTRNYFASIIPLDSYNTSQVTVNRGANNILFGLGSPAGIIDRSLSRPMRIDANEVSIRTDKYGSLRSTFDLNRTLMEEKLNVRLIGLHDWREFRQAGAFDKSRRVYGALDFHPLKNTVIRLNVEMGDRDGSPEVLAPPRDRLSYWWTRLDQATFGVGETAQPVPFFTDLAGTNRNPVFIFADGVGDTQADLGVISLNNGAGLQGAKLQTGDPLYDLVPANRRANYQPRFIAVNDPNRVARGASQNQPLARFSRSTQIIDTSVYDYNNISMAGRNDRRFNDFTAYNIALQQELLDGDLGFELSHDQQDFDGGSLDFIGAGFRNRNIGLDVNEVYPNGTPNPNVGRPFVTTRPVWRENSNELKTTRVTGYLKFDAEKKLGDVGKWFGNHTFTALYDESESKTFNISGSAMTLDTDFGNAIGYRPANNIINGWLLSQTMHYIGDSLAGTSSAAGANLPGLPASFDLPDKVSMNYISTPNRQFETATFDTLLYPQDKEILTSRAFLERNETKSQALAWQTHWLGGDLVSTFGWRNDKFKNFGAGDAEVDIRGTRQVGSDVFKLTDTPELDTEGDTFSWGVVGHAPQGIKENLPLGMDVSVHYAQSENFAPSSVSRNPFGGFYNPPSGSTEDYGTTISLFDNKIVARLTWYETVQQNLSDSRLTGPYNWFFLNVAAQVYDNNDWDDIVAADFELPVQAIQDAYNWNIITNPDGSRTIDGESLGANDIIKAVSKGFEMDLTANLTSNWRVSLNAAQQEAVRTGTAQTALEEVNRLANAWLNNPAQGDLLENNLNPVRGRIGQQMGIINTYLVADGRKADELREWRVNLVTNYTFAKDSRLKGFGVGGAMRYQSENAIGSDFIEDPDLGWIPVVESPVWGPTDTKFDAWFSYRTKIMKNIDWTLRLNIRNVLNENDLIPTFHNPDGSGFVYRSAKECDWFLTSTFKF